MHAKKTTINFSGIELEVFQLPHGEYQLSRTQVSESIDLKRSGRDFPEFLEGKSPEALMCKDYNFPEILTEGAGRPIKGTPFKIAIIYWSYHAKKGNIKAQALLAAGTEETLTRLADQAFGVVKAEQQYSLDTKDNFEVYEQLLPMMQTLLTEMQSIKQELLILRPAYEELQTLNKTFQEIKELKPLLESIAEVINKPNQSKNTLRGWLKNLSLDKSVSASQCKAIGRAVANWLKVGNMENYIEKKNSTYIYKESLVPLIMLATKYQLFGLK